MRKVGISCDRSFLQLLAKHLWLFTLVNQYSIALFYHEFGSMIPQWKFFGNSSGIEIPASESFG